MDEDADVPAGSTANTKRILHGYANPVGAPLPTVNWWKGKLRPYESALSFAACFCALNGIPAKQHEHFFGYAVGEEWRLDQAGLQRIAALLQEASASVESVFVPTVRLELTAYWAAPSLDGVRYCRHCAQLGYHSYLHEVAWLDRCPFHLTELTWVPNQSEGTSRAKRKLGTLTALLRSHCRGWPLTDDGDAVLQQRMKEGYLPLLQAWTQQAREAGARLSTILHWDASEPGAARTHSAEHLRCIAPMPHALTLLTRHPDPAWDVDIRHFSDDVKAELLRLDSVARLWTIFDFFKRVAAQSRDAPPFIGRLRAAQQALDERHGACRCHWAIERAGWVYHWVKVRPPGSPRWNGKCPYRVAIDALELHWGDPSRVLSRRKTHEDLLGFIESSRVIRDAGLIDFAEGANVSPQGYLYAYPQIWPCCIWRESSPLTSLLHTMAEFEVDAAVDELTVWLDAINEETPPVEREGFEDLVRLREEENGLSVLRWIRTGTPNA